LMILCDSSILKKNRIMAEETQHQEDFNPKKIQLILFISFLMGFSVSLTAFVTSNYYKLAWSTDSVGLFYILPHAIGLLFLLNINKLIVRFGKSFMLLSSYVVQMVLLFALALSGVSHIGSYYLMAYVLFVTVVWLNLDIILESFSIDKASGQIRGIHLTITNIGFILGPVVSTMILDKFAYEHLFFVVLFLNMLMFILGIIGLRKVNHVPEKSMTVREIFRTVRKRKDVGFIYWVSMTLSMFYALMVIYTPIYLLDLGLTWGEIGMIFSLMLIPFVLFQYPAGRLADKRMGEKELIIFALAVMSISTFAIYFIESLSVAVWAAVLFTTRIGASLLEILRDSYFYKKIDGSDVAMISFFRTGRPMGYIIASALSVIFLQFFSVKIVFILLTLILFIGFYPALRLTDNKAENEA